MAWSMVQLALLGVEPLLGARVPSIVVLRHYTPYSIIHLRVARSAEL